MENKEEIEIHPILKKPIRVAANADGSCPVGYEWDATVPGCVLQIGPPPASE